MRSGTPHGVESVSPITDDDATIAEALRDVSVPVLAAAIVHLTGNPSVVRGPIRPRQFIINEFQGALDDDERNAIREQALREIIAYRDAGCPGPFIPDEALTREIMDWIACEPVADDYAEMFAEEMDLAGTDPRRLAAVTASDRRLSVLVIGCGQSGLLAGVRLQQAGIDFEIVDKNDDVGGTWLENTYPGCRVDVANHYYCYSFEPNSGFRHFYSQQPELHAYFRDVMNRHGLEHRVRWKTTVERLDWDEASSCWRVAMRSSDGTLSTTTADVVISAVGQLNRPFVPAFPGLARFSGPVVHSAQWRPDVDLAGKRVAMIGAGASGFQLGPAISDEVDQLYVFQRTAQWMAPNPRYHDAVDPGTVWAMQHLPGFSRWYRFMLLWQSSDKALDVIRIDPDWPGLPHSANALSAQRREVLVQYLRDQVGDDPELLAKVTPDYPPMGKRMLQDNGSWLRCLQRPNVELITDDIEGFDEHGIVTDKRRYDVDVVVMATGFRANEFLSPMHIVGRDGRTLEEFWGGRPTAYLGISVPNFPNLFMMYGPGTNLAHAGSIIFNSECQMRYIGGCIEQIQKPGATSIEPTVAAYESYVERLQAELATTAWAHDSIKHSWYKAADGKVYVLSPWRLVDYWAMTARPDPDEHELRTQLGR